MGFSTSKSSRFEHGDVGRDVVRRGGDARAGHDDFRLGRGQGNAAVGGKKNPDQGHFSVRGDCVSVAAHEGGLMPKFLRRHSVAVLTIAALASFHIAHAQNAAPPAGAFRDNPAWTVVDGALTTQAEAGKTPLVSQGHARRQRHHLRFPRARRRARHVVRAGADMPSSSSGMATGSPSRCGSARRASTWASTRPSPHSCSTCATVPTFVVTSASKAPVKARSGITKTAADLHSSSCARRVRSRCATLASSRPISNN